MDNELKNRQHDNSGTIEETANKAEWQPFDALPKLDCPFCIKYWGNEEPGPTVLRIHREPRTLPHLQCQDGSEWKDVDMVNASWIVRNCEWLYVEELVKEKI